jgi:hydroxypyruvate isomerase
VSEALPIAANISTLFRELPLLERFQAARSHGFDGVEIQVPYSESPEALARAAGAAGMPVVLINVPVAAAEHPFGIAGRPELKPLFRAHLAQAAEYAEALSVSFVHVLAGLAPPVTDREECLRTYADNLDIAAGILHPKGIVVLIEPLNPIDVPGYLLNSFDAARSILSRRPPGIGMQFDAYHATRMGLDLIDELGRALPYVRHVQFADVPGRHEPGTGSVPFRDLLIALSDARYAGWLGAEYFPMTTTDRSLGWLAEWRAATNAPSEAP